VLEICDRDDWLAGPEADRCLRTRIRTWLTGCVLAMRPHSSCSRRDTRPASRERRSVPVDDMQPVIDGSRFGSAGNWAMPPEPWADQVEDRLVAAKMADRVLAAIDDLPPQQREAVTLRDVQGMTSAEACAVLGISPANQRVLLHRGRSRLREVIESEFGRTR
jgi:RNA polymerase sigma-70 factor (ECF subfamily)